MIKLLLLNFLQVKFCGPPRNDGNNLFCIIITKYILKGDGIEEYEPALAVSGHIHEARAIDNIGPSTLINPGPFKDGFYGICEINGTVKSCELKEL